MSTPEEGRGDIFFFLFPCDGCSLEATTVPLNETKKKGDDARHRVYTFHVYCMEMKRKMFSLSLLLISLLHTELVNVLSMQVCVSTLCCEGATSQLN